MPARANQEKDRSRLPRFIVALLDPSAYPHPTTRIELRQTHISYVLLTGTYAYKIKKPVNFGFLDYSTLNKRKHFCYEEVRLNSRLCPEIYLGVVEVGETRGKVLMEGGQRLIDYAVKMVQLPESRTLDRLLDNDQVTDGMMPQLAAKLVEFYRRTRGGPGVEQFGEPKWIRVNTEENFVQTQPFIGRTISSSQYRLIKEYTERFLQENHLLFKRRIKEGRIRDGHGDLRPENICFTNPSLDQRNNEGRTNGLCIFDCVEFNERLRCGDVASDIAFLIMELERRSRFDLSRQFIDAYIQRSADTGVLGVLNFYKVYRAYVRGKVESFKLEEPEIPEIEKRRSLEMARRYFDLAAFYTKLR